MLFDECWHFILSDMSFVLDVFVDYFVGSFFEIFCLLSCFFGE